MNAGLLPPLADPPPELQTRPLVLVVNRSPDRRLFLQTSLQGRCRVATASTGAEGAMHLRRCSPRALVAGRASGRAAREALEADLQGPEAPATLTLWVTIRRPNGPTRPSGIPLPGPICFRPSPTCFPVGHRRRTTSRPERTRPQTGPRRGGSVGGVSPSSTRGSRAAAGTGAGGTRTPKAVRWRRAARRTRGVLWAGRPPQGRPAPRRRRR